MKNCLFNDSSRNARNTKLKCRRRGVFIWTRTVEAINGDLMWFSLNFLSCIMYDTDSHRIYD